MPLTLATVTVASRIMLPTYVMLFAGLGLNYTLALGRLNTSPVLDYADRVLPLPVWGVMFLTVSVVMGAAMAKHHRTLSRFGLWLGIVCMGVWAVVFTAAAIWNGGSPGAPLWPAFAAVCCYASDRSLLKGEAS